MLLDGRHGQETSTNGNKYKYGFQGQEMDDEIKGEGNSVNYKYRMHDPRIGRFFAIDPLADEYPHNSPYAFSENVVISHVELEGLEKRKAVNCEDLLIQDHNDGQKGPRFQKITITHAKTIIEEIETTPAEKITPRGLNKGLNRQFRLGAGGTFNFDAFDVQDGILIRSIQNGNIVYANNLQQGSTGDISVPPGTYQVIITPNTNPANLWSRSNTRWKLEVTDNAKQETHKKTRYLLFGVIPIYTKVEKQETDATGTNPNGVRTIKRKILGITFSIKKSSGNINLYGRPTPDGGKIKSLDKQRINQLPELKMLTI